LSLVWDENRADLAVHSSTPEQLDALRATATRLVEIMQSTTRVSRPELRALPSLHVEGRATAWLTALDYAKEHDLVLWCDDRVLRALARSEGVATFGTATLLDACLQNGLLQPEEHVVIKAELLRNHFVDLPFSTDLYRAAAQADGWRARAVCTALSRPGAWSDPNAAAAFSLDAASRSVGSLPDEASRWLGCAYAGLHRATAPSHRSRNLKVYSWQVLTQPWLSTSTLPFALAGLHAGITAAASTDAPLRAALTQYYGALVGQLGHVAAASALMALFALADEKDKNIAARIVLTHPDQ
jgi:predicted nucleic acid-binding protein